MSETQSELDFDTPPPTSPAVGTDLPGEIAAAWGLPIGEKVEVCFRKGSLDAITGVLELAAVPDYPWNPRQPLALRISGFVFNSRDVEHWMRV